MYFCLRTRSLPVPPQLIPLMVAVLKARARAIEAVEKARATAIHGSELLKAEFPCWEVRAHGSSDSPTWGLIQEAEAWNADLIVVGSHGRTAVGRVILGSVAQRVVTNAPCSVRVARSYKEESPPPLHLVLGYDGSAASAAVVDAVAARAWPARTILDLVTVIEPMSIALALASLKNHQAGKIPRTKNYIRMWLKTMNESAAEKLHTAGLAVSSVVIEGEPQNVLLREARKSKADCIFLGARGIRAIQRFLLGSVSTAVTARAPCTVEVIRPGRMDAPTVAE